VGCVCGVLIFVLWQKLAAKDLDNWEQKRVKSCLASTTVCCKRFDWETEYVSGYM
jgi:hypothetical protein